jgi:ubiquinone/menaquinone biosynthesis C-methylase UbiE
VDRRLAVRAAYDELADAYADVADPASTPEPVERLRADLAPDDDVLSAGCGAGDAPLLAAGEHGVGIDCSREQLTRARRSVPAALVQGDLTALPFAADSFDVVAALYSLIHVPLDEHRTALAEFARVLRPGGTLLVTEGEREWTGSNPDWLGSGTAMYWSVAGAEATREDLRAAGFELRDEWLVDDPTTEDGAHPFFLADLD